MTCWKFSGESLQTQIEHTYYIYFKHKFTSNMIIYVYIKSFIVRSESLLTIFDY